MHVVVLHTMRDEQVILEAFSEVDRRAPFVSLRVVERVVENPGGVAVVVVRPVGDRSVGGARREHAGMLEERHQSEKPTVAGAFDPDAMRTHLYLFSAY